MADSVSLKNGDHLSGKVEAITAEHVLLVTDYAGTLTLPRDLITEVAVDENLLVAKPKDDAAADALTEPAVNEAGQTLLSLENVAVAAVDLISMPERANDWQSRVDLGSAVSKGNTETTTFTALLATELKRGTTRHRGAIGFDRREDEGRTTKDQLDVDYSFDWFVHPKWYLGFNTEYFRDQQKDVDSRITLGALLGHQFWDHSLGRLGVEGGLSYVTEERSSGSENNAALRWALDYNRFIYAKQVEVYHEHEILVLADTSRGQIFNSSSGLRLKFAASWAATLGLDFDYETKPVPGRDKADVTYTAGLGYEF